MSDALKVAVVGVGHLGRYHAKKVLLSERADLVGLVDRDVERAASVGEELEQEVAVADSIEKLPVRPDAVIIATTTSAHEEVALDAARMGLHMLIEKPIAPSPDAARRIVEATRSNGKVLQVGHTERFNPAIEAVLNMDLSPLYLTAERLGPFSGRSFDVDVVLDLMIHDIDILASMVPSDLVEVRAVGLPIVTNETDMASARLAFADGTVAELKAGRASMEASRKIRLITEDRYVSVDCATQQVKSVKRSAAPDGGQWPQISGEAIDVKSQDALEAQLSDFLDAVELGKAPRVDGEQGLRAVTIAWEVQKALDGHSHERTH